MELYHKFKNSKQKKPILNEDFEIKEVIDDNKNAKESPSKLDFKSRLDDESSESLSNVSKTNKKDKKKSSNLLKKFFKKRSKSSKK